MKPQPQSFGSLMVQSFTEHWLHTRSHAVGMMIFVTFFWAVLLIAIDLVSSLIGSDARTIPILQLGVVVFFILMTVTWIVVAYEQTRINVGEVGDKRAFVASAITLVPTLVIAVVLTWATATYTLTILSQPLTIPVTDFTSCAKAGGVILQTSPQQCVTQEATYTQEQ